ncbi:MAG: hypothetical protein IIW19_03695 [Clostridia bacterium]|nr:hypothetical protein [Clostridia bacterium]
MAVSLRNFFLTFVLALAAFGWLAFEYYDELLALLPTENVEVSQETSQESTPPEEESGPGTIILPGTGGDELGSLSGLAVTLNENGEVTRALFLRFNSARKAVLTCELPLTATLYNDVGAMVPLRDFLRLYDRETCSMAIAALVGYSADFYVEVSPDALDAMVKNMSAPYFVIPQEINYVNPAYTGITEFPGGKVPADYWKHVDAGKITMTADILAILREHYSLCDGSDGHGSYSSLASSMLRSFLDQLTKEQKTVLLSDPARYAAVLSGMNTNMDAAFMEEWGELLMKYGTYPKTEITYTTRDATIRAFKEADR